VLERHDRPLRALAFRLLGDRDRMDDVLQDAYVKAFRSLPRFRRGSSIETWLYRIVYNACLDELRRRRADRTQSLELVPELGSAVDPADASGRSGLLADALGGLAPEPRAAVLLVDAGGFDYRTAAEILGVEVGTLASRLGRGRASLRRALSTTHEGAEQR
jgi:RNA polymerase sigma-70 factor (ECF subfamily)